MRWSLFPRHMSCYHLHFQVKFKIFKECLPIPESSLRYVIKENYTGAKFKQELSGKQVSYLSHIHRSFNLFGAGHCHYPQNFLLCMAKEKTYHWKQVEKLISSFRPLAASVCQPAQQALTHVTPRPGAIPPSLLEYQQKRLPVMEIPYLAEVQYSHIQPVAEARPVLNVNYPEHGSYRSAAYVENVHPSLDHQSLPAASSYVSHPERPLYAHRVQEPSYSRYFLDMRE